MSERDELSVDRVAKAFDVVIKSMRKDERDLEKAIEERDAAEEALSQAYFIVTGNSPEWSNLFGHDQALDDIRAACEALRAAARASQIGGIDG